MQSLTLHDEDGHLRPFNYGPLDALIAAVRKGSPLNVESSIVELMSTQPGGGKTHLLYHLVASAVLPEHIGGQQSCVVIIDADGRFSVPRLVQQLAKLVCGRASTISDDELESILQHVHICRTQSLASTIATAESLPAYLYDPAKHRSSDRPLAFIALDSASAFTWQARADSEDAALLASTSESATRSPQQQTSGYAELAGALQGAVRELHCPLVYTCWHRGQARTNDVYRAYTYRSPFPPPWHGLPTVRFVVGRVPVRKMPAEVTLESAMMETIHRQQIVDEGRFECVVNEWSISPNQLRLLHESRTRFEFRIDGDGLHFDA